MKKAVVTGGAGFIGSELVRSLLNDDWQVSVVDNLVRAKVTQFSENQPNLTFYNVDLTETNNLDEAFSNADIVYHLAAVNGTSNFYRYPSLVINVGIRGMLNVVDACKKHNVRNLVIASSAEVYQDAEVIPTPEGVALSIPDVTNPRYSYAISKIATEGLAMALDDDFFDKVLLFRPHNIYGANMGWRHVIPQLIQKAYQLQIGASNFLKIEGDGTQTRAFCHVKDAVVGIRLMADKGTTKNIYHIGNSEEISIEKLAHQICEYIGAPRKIEYSTLPSGSPIRRCPDLLKMKSLGYNPEINIKEGLRTTIDWYVSNMEQASNSDID